MPILEKAGVWSFWSVAVGHHPRLPYSETRRTVFKAAADKGRQNQNEQFLKSVAGDAEVRFTSRGIERSQNWSTKWPIGKVLYGTWVTLPLRARKSLMFCAWYTLAGVFNRSTAVLATDSLLFCPMGRT